MNDSRKPDPSQARAAGRFVDDPSIPVLTERLDVLAGAGAPAAPVAAPHEQPASPVAAPHEQPAAGPETGPDITALEQALRIADLSDFDELLQAEPAGPLETTPPQFATGDRATITAAIEAELRSRLSRELPSLIEARLQPQLARIGAQAAEQIAVAVSDAMSDALREAIDHAVGDALRARRL